MGSDMTPRLMLGSKKTPGPVIKVNNSKRQFNLRIEWHWSALFGVITLTDCSTTPFPFLRWRANVLDFFCQITCHLRLKLHGDQVLDMGLPPGGYVSRKVVTLKVYSGRAPRLKKVIWDSQILADFWNRSTLNPIQNQNLNLKQNLNQKQRFKFRWRFKVIRGHKYYIRSQVGKN